MTEAHHRVEEIKDREKALREAMEEKAPEVQALKKQLEEVKIRNEKVLDDMDMADEKLNLHIQNMSQRAEKIEKKRDKIQQLQTIVAKQEAKAQETTVEANRTLRRARKLAFKRTQKKQRKQDGLDTSQESEPIRDPTEEELEWFDIQEVDQDPSYFEPRIALQQAKIEKERKRREVANELSAVAPRTLWTASSSRFKRLNSILSRCFKI
jgi:chromosome segregation ATPase